MCAWDGGVELKVMHMCINLCMQIFDINASINHCASTQCLEKGQTPENFPKDTPLENRMGVQTYVRWTVFLQYPVLSYLDSMRKPALINSIAEIVNRPVEEFCIATVENYRISYYDES